jgi:hypothetical protein
MQNSGLGATQVSQVRGYADQMPRTTGQPFDASNRRISVIVQNLAHKAEDTVTNDKPEKTETKPEATAVPSLPKKD